MSGGVSTCTSLLLRPCLQPLICDNRDDERAGAVPVQLLRRIRVGGMWWVLVEYDDDYETQGWKGFADESALKEFAEVNVGEPLAVPPVSLSPGESATVVRIRSNRLTHGRSFPHQAILKFISRAIRF